MKRKLVRDNIPSIAEEFGSDNEFHVYDTHEEYIEGLANKILEEGLEVCKELESRLPEDDNDIMAVLEELGDLLEVLDTCAVIKRVDDSTKALQVICADDTFDLQVKYALFDYGDFGASFRTSCLALYTAFLSSNELETLNFERELYTVCSIIASFLLNREISVTSLKDMQNEKWVDRGGFDYKYYMIMK